MALSRRERREQRWKLIKEERLEQLKKADENQAIFQKKEYTGFLKIYDKYYLQLLVIPILILIIAIGLVGYKIATTGDFINKGVSLKGGITITVPTPTPVDIQEIDSLLEQSLPGSEIDVRSATELGVQKSIIITTDNVNAEETILNTLSQKIPTAKNTFSSETTGSALGGSFFKETTKAMLFAFIFMGIVVFISFRTFAPSMMVILAVFADIIETIAAVNLLGLNISAAGIAAFLMLIGYSVDTDILLTSRVIRGKEGTVFNRVLSAAKTGLMMTATALIAVLIALFMTQNETIREIMIILAIGLFFDIINTWLTNTALLRYYVEHIKPKRVLAAAAKEQARTKKDIAREEKEAKELGLDLDSDDEDSGSVKKEVSR